VLKPELILGFLDKGRRGTYEQLFNQSLSLSYIIFEEKSGLKEEIEKLWKGVNTSEERYEILK